MRKEPNVPMQRRQEGLVTAFYLLENDKRRPEKERMGQKKWKCVNIGQHTKKVQHKSHTLWIDTFPKHDHGHLFEGRRFTMNYSLKFFSSSIYEYKMVLQ